MRKQSKEELNKWYGKREDPWGYKGREDDAVRKKKILSSLPDYISGRVLDLSLIHI